jgi:hypothetical protein
VRPYYDEGGIVIYQKDLVSLLVAITWHMVGGHDDPGEAA